MVENQSNSRVQASVNRGPYTLYLTLQEQDGEYIITKKGVEKNRPSILGDKFFGVRDVYSVGDTITEDKYRKLKDD